MNLPKGDMLRIIQEKYPSATVQGLFAQFIFDLGDTKRIIIEDQAYLKKYSGLSYDPDF